MRECSDPANVEHFCASTWWTTLGFGSKPCGSVGHEVPHKEPKAAGSPSGFNGHASPAQDRLFRPSGSGSRPEFRPHGGRGRDARAGAHGAASAGAKGGVGAFLAAGAPHRTTLA